MDNMDGDVLMGQSEGSDLETSLKQIMESKSPPSVDLGHATPLSNHMIEMDPKLWNE
ncbi:MAG: hypothetical protein Q9214_000681 [Letrouitia sp. 1 TL-2023]